MYRGQLEEKAKTLVDYLLAHPNVIVFMDELHSILGVGADPGAAQPLC